MRAESRQPGDYPGRFLAAYLRANNYYPQMMTAQTYAEGAVLHENIGAGNYSWPRYITSHPSSDQIRAMEHAMWALHNRHGIRPAWMRQPMTAAMLGALQSRLLGLTMITKQSIVKATAAFAADTLPDHFERYEPVVGEPIGAQRMAARELMLSTDPTLSRVRRGLGMVWRAGHDSLDPRLPANQAISQRIHDGYRQLVSPEVRGDPEARQRVIAALGTVPGMLRSTILGAIEAQRDTIEAAMDRPLHEQTLYHFMNQTVSSVTIPG